MDEENEVENDALLGIRAGDEQSSWSFWLTNCKAMDGSRCDDSSSFRFDRDNVEEAEDAEYVSGEPRFVLDSSPDDFVGVLSTPASFLKYFSFSSLPTR